MSGVDFHVRVDGQDLVEHRLAVLAARVGDLTPLMDIIGTVLETDAQDHFIGEHAPDGTPWTPSRRAIRDGGKTGQDTRRLFLSLTHRATATSTEVGTNVVYARCFHDGFDGTETVASHKRVMREAFGVKLAEPIEVTVGSFTRKANQPARPFLGMSAGAREDIEGAVADYADAEA